ncbi:hypothetical protein [Aminipila sp.]|uniref:hypothetical protein n=1 Tax=Aminipila sp. TaxID=2060095 RepID=UPI00289AD030|nr:hypothetical protein [Aminipila sp.]
MTSMMIYHPGDIFEDYAKNNPFEMGIFLEFTLPYYLTLNRGFYTFSVKENFFAPYLIKERKITFELDSRCRDSQSVPLREATFQFEPNDLNIWNYKYTVFNSGLRILIETFNDERDSIIQQIKNNGKEVMIALMQSCLEFILFKYNETSDGIHAISPSVYDCSHLSFNFVYSNFIIEYMTITGNLNTIQQVNDDSFREALNSDIIVWKAFLNESKYAFKTFDYKKSIIYTAIAFESFITSLIYSKTPDPNSYEKEGPNFLTIRTKVHKLMDNNYLKSKLDKSDIDYLINDIAYPRNDMVHGKVFELSNLRQKAEKSIEAFQILQDNWM